MSYDKWWEDTDEDFKRKLIDQELEDADLQDNPIATEGWGVFLAKGLSKVGISSLENKLSQKSADKIMSVFKEPRVVQWIYIQAELILKQASLYAKKFINPDIKITFATSDDIKKYSDNPLNGIIDYDGTSKITTDLEFKKCFTFNIKCGKYMLQVNADSTSIKRVFLFLKTSEKTLNLATIKAPDDQELLKIVGAIESAEIVEEGLISKIKSFIGSNEVALESAELYDFTYGVEQVSESLFTLDNLDDSTKMMLFGTAALGVVSAGVGFIKHIGYELGDTVGKGIRNKLNNREYKKFIRAVNDPEVQRFLKEQCNEVFEEAKKKFPNVTKKVSAVDGKAVETGAKKVKSSKGIIGRFFSSPNIIPVKAGEYLVILDGTPSEGVKTAVVVLQDADTKKYICSLLTPPTLMAESLGLGAMLGAAAVGTFIGKNIRKRREERDAKEKEDFFKQERSADEYKKWMAKNRANPSQRSKIYSEAKKIVKSLAVEGIKFHESDVRWLISDFLKGESYLAPVGVLVDKDFNDLSSINRVITEANKALQKKFGKKYFLCENESMSGPEEHVRLLNEILDRYWKLEAGTVLLVDVEFNRKLMELEKPGVLRESYDPTTEGWGVKAAENVEAAGWAYAFFGCLATIFSFGYALNFKGIWAMIIGGYAVDKIGGGVKSLLQKKGNKYLEKVLANPEMSAYIRGAAKEVVAGIKKQAASMKDSKYEISTKAEDIDKFEASVFNQGFKAPGEETDSRIEFDRKSYFYIEKKLGEYSIVLLYDTNSIKGIYVVVAIKDTKDKFGSSWLRARPIPPPTSEELKKMGFKG